jgi:branched-chain amino acid aminotransferase
MAADVKITRCSAERTLPDFSKLAFGVENSDHMIDINYTSRDGWGVPQIKPFEMLQIHPFNSALHYAV